MEYNNLLELIKTVSALNISGFQYEEGDVKIIITTGGNGLPGAVNPSSIGSVCSAPTAAAVAQGSAAVQTAANTQSQNVAQSDISASQVELKVQNAGTAQSTGNIVKSPLVGTFYAAPAEDAEPFVKVGDVVKKGQTLAIVEAMKLMNDIETEYDGTILEIFVDNGATVEYGQPLFSIG
ncbi:MAG: acetyl-CoA carboxylase biotin carboxyl carrier protein [Lachnospiraceae bacterium]|nr:acetyl-CoA carboxylase biotin carboxyl carrier protein [Lachnospiraceae bacterium]